GRLPPAAGVGHRRPATARAPRGRARPAVSQCAHGRPEPLARRTRRVAHVSDEDTRDNALNIVNNKARSRFEVSVDGHLAELVYRRVGDRLILVHTGVPDELEGHGIGGELVRAAVDEAEREGLTVVPWCPFARSWLDRHPDVAQRVRIADVR